MHRQHLLPGPRAEGIAPSTSPITIKELVDVGARSAVSGNGNGNFQGNFTELEATIKSKKHFPGEADDWAYFSSATPDHKTLNAKAQAFPTASCNGCHAGAAADDFGITRCDPVLRAGKAKGAFAGGGKSDLLGGEK